MEASLFRKRPIRRGWMVLMVIGSFLFHGLIVSLGYAIWQPISQPIEIPTTVVDLAPTLGDPEVRELVVPMDAPTPPPDQPTPPPDSTPPPDDTPPPSEEPEMDEPDKPTPPPKPKVAVARPAATPAPAGAKRGPVAVAGVVGGNPNGTKSTGTPGGAAIGKWTTPKPGYPAAARASRITGSTTVSFSTDASGNISSVNITQSAGNALLDHHTQVFVKSNWHGPPNSTLSKTFEYRMP